MEEDPQTELLKFIPQAERITTLSRAIVTMFNRGQYQQCMNYLEALDDEMIKTNKIHETIREEVLNKMDSIRDP